MMVMRCLPWAAVVGAVGLAVSSVATAADSFTAGVLSCAAETDRERRLDCYDREVAGYTAGLARRGQGSAVAAAPAAKVGALGVAGGPTAAAAAPGAAASGASGTTAAAEGAAARHFAGRVASVEHFPDYVVVHLDNQQTWKQVSDSPGGLALRTGDAVTIDKQMGSWWLAGPKGEAVQVRLEAPRS